MLLRHLRYLLAVADHGGFTRAAEALHVSQPTLSQQIRQLEETLGVSLFDRTSRTVKPTDAGVAYIECARCVLVELEAGQRALHDVKDLSRGTLRLAMTPTFMAYLVGPLVRDYGARFPGIHLEIFELSMDDIEAGLADDIAGCRDRVYPGAQCRYRMHTGVYRDAGDHGRAWASAL